MWLQQLFKPPKTNDLTTPTFSLNWDNCNPELNGETQFLSFYAKNWKHCFDIGANKGDYTRQLLSFNPSCRVIAFEPNPDLIEDLHQSGATDVVNAAVSETNGTTHIYFHQQYPEMSSIHRKTEETKMSTIKKMSLDSYVQKNNIKHLDFIKIDTEGHEVSVLKGMKKIIINQLADIIQFEYGGTYLDANTKLLDAYKLLSSKYVLCMLMPTGVLPLKYDKQYETYRYSNWIAFSKNYA